MTNHRTQALQYIQSAKTMLELELPIQFYAYMRKALSHINKMPDSVQKTRAKSAWFTANNKVKI